MLNVSAICIILLALVYNAQLESCKLEEEDCEPGMVLPMWKPKIINKMNESAINATGEETYKVSVGERAGRAILYFIILMYVFLGKSIVCDKFMEAIEHITSREKEVRLRKINGEEYTVMVRVWNGTVASLTLMALGSSAPEILISVIEIVGNEFQAGELGPGSIVGSAAFNLLLIVPICVWAVPTKEIRRIKNLDVFWVTAVWSIFAYIWLYMILSVISEGIVELWEAILTFMFFPMTVITSYITDKKYIIHFYKKFARTSSKRPFSVDMMSNGSESEEIELQRQNYMQIFKELRDRYPEASIDDVVECTKKEIFNRTPKSYAYHRINAMKKLTGSGDMGRRVAKSANSLTRFENTPSATASRENLVACVFVKFDKFMHVCMEDVGILELTVFCERNEFNIDSTVQVDFKTENGTALAGTDYSHREGTLTFGPKEDKQIITIDIIDDDEFETDEHFQVLLSNPKATSSDGSSVPCKIGNPSHTTIIVIDNDHCGAFGFENETFEITDPMKEIHLKVVRTHGGKGNVKVPFKTVVGTAKENKHFVAKHDELEFKDGQLESMISVEMLVDQEYDESIYFYVELSEPLDEKLTIIEKDNSAKQMRGFEKFEKAQEANDGRAKLSKIGRCKIVIRENRILKGVSDKLMSKAKFSSIGTSTWKEQLEEAVTVSSSSEEEDAKPGLYDYVMHYLSLPWKVMFAVVIPPTVYWGGWLTFIVSLGVIGIFTTLVIDICMGFGCTIDLNPMILSITIIALGTSLPDVYACKIAALHEETADSSIVTVTGTNAVNVFLGIGIAWTIAAVYHAINGTKFIVKPGSLAFNVTLFCVEAVLAVIFLQVRRYNKTVYGELGGPLNWKILTVLIFVGMWILYLLLSALQVYCVINGF